MKSKEAYISRKRDAARGLIEGAEKMLGKKIEVLLGLQGFANLPHPVEETGAKTCCTIIAVCSGSMVKVESPPFYTTENV